MSWQACSPSCLICCASSLRALTTISSMRADVASFAPDDPALELVRGEVDDRDRRLAALLGRLALHRRDENLAAALGRLLADLDLGLTDPFGDLGDQLALDA